MGTKFCTLFIPGRPDELDFAAIVGFFASPTGLADPMAAYRAIMNSFAQAEGKPEAPPDPVRESMVRMLLSNVNREQNGETVLLAGAGCTAVYGTRATWETVEEEAAALAAAIGRPVAFAAAWEDDVLIWGAYAPSGMAAVSRSGDALNVYDITPSALSPLLLQAICPTLAIDGVPDSPEAFATALGFVHDLPRNSRRNYLAQFPRLTKIDEVGVYLLPADD